MLQRSQSLEQAQLDLPLFHPLLLLSVHTWGQLAGASGAGLLGVGCGLLIEHFLVRGVQILLHFLSSHLFDGAAPVLEVRILIFVTGRVLEVGGE